MDVDIIVNEDLSYSVRISLTPKENTELGKLADAVADEILIKIAKQLKVDLSEISVTIDKSQIERHSPHGVTDLQHIQAKNIQKN